MKHDYYAVLGVEPTATGAAIHASYRRHALAYHPQKQHEDPQRVRSLFYQINEAYDVLKDRLLRALYDQLGYDGLTTKFNSIPGHPYGYRYHGRPLKTFEDHFGTTHAYADAYAPRDSANEYHLYADIFRARAKDTLPPIMLDLEVTLEELFHGSIREVEYTRIVVNEDEASLLEEKVTRDIHVRPGWRTGTRIVFDKAGNQGKDKIPSDVIVYLVELPHQRYFRDGNDLRMKIEVDLLVALCGGDITVTSIDDTPIRIEETNVIKPGSSRNIPGFGMPIAGDLTTRGDLHLDYFVNFPIDMDLARREMIASALKSRQKKPAVPTTLIGVTGFDPKHRFVGHTSKETAPEEPLNFFITEEFLTT
ncbi:putative DnaJ-like protein subfamily B member 13 [Hypsibius exemplaris]|uniref:DnaJ-like protein subfamily B member 13 n=1 Tax=Hypsibius exemplaris TaxID=2072580 RepID=A0A9X6NAI1_HYPEX|nr:putative DnaJ-like protein subfamily B member 13 [Hypsibius exemplaris]